MKGGLQTLTDIASRWLEEHDPDFDDVEAGRVSNRHGVITPRGANRIKKFEYRFSESASDHPAHCPSCARKSEMAMDRA